MSTVDDTTQNAENIASPAIASVLYNLGSLGNVRTETLKAFSMDEAANIIEKLT